MKIKEVQQAATDKFEVTKTPKIETAVFTAYLATGANCALPANVVCVRFISWITPYTAFGKTSLYGGHCLLR